MPPLTIQPTTCHRRRCRRRHPQARPLDQLAQRALQDLLSVAGLEHEDSWEAATAPDPLPQTPQQQQPPPPPASGQHPTLAGVPTTARRPSVHLGASGPSAASELAAVYAPEEPLPPAAGFEDDDGSGLPAAAALRLYQARLRAAQANLVGLQAALKAKEAKLGGLEKEAQQLRWVLKVQWSATRGQWWSSRLCLFGSHSSAPLPVRHTPILATPAIYRPPRRQEKAAWLKQQKALEAAAERSKRAADEARARAAEQEAAVKQIEAERRAGQQERCVCGQEGGSTWLHGQFGCQGSADVQIHADVQEGRQSKMPS